MPVYSYRCLNGHLTDSCSTVAAYQSEIACSACHSRATRYFTPPILVAAQADVQYTSPITGEPIQSRTARREDMARHGCVEYDPGMKQDADRKREESQQQFEAAIERTVYSEMAKMPSEKKIRLAREVIEGGLTPEPVRLTPEMA